MSCKQTSKGRSVQYAFVVVGLIALLAAAPETSSQNIKIINPWVHETSGSSALLHVTIANTGRSADHLLRGSTNIAAKVAIWNQLGKQGAGLSIPGGAEFVLGGDAPRIELMGLTETLRAPTSFQMLLVFERAGKIVINVLVEHQATN